MWIFKKKEVPQPIYKRQPIATAAVILTVIGMFVLGPIGAVYKGMTEELKKKANNETVILYMQQQKEKDDQQWKAIERIIESPKGLAIESDNVKVEKKVALTPSEFEAYMKMTPEHRSKYKEYLKISGKDISNLPE